MTALAQLLDATGKLRETLDTIEKLLPAAKAETHEDHRFLIRKAEMIFDEILYDEQDRRRADDLSAFVSICSAEPWREP